MSLISFPRFRSNRLDVQLRELSIGQAMDVAVIDVDKHEATATKFLNFAIAESVGKEVDPRLWTVQERTAVIAHYLANTTDGDRNFEVIGNDQAGRYLDYLDGDHDYPCESIDLGEIGGDKWSISHVLGAHAVIMEDVCKSRTDWIFADMSVRMSREGESKPDPLRESGKYADFLKERIEVLKAYPESEAGELFISYMSGISRLHHIFHLRFDDSGFLIDPKNGGAALLAARFLASECVSDLARALCR